MIKINVETIWHGQVAIRDKYLQESQETEQDILIVHGDAQMRIPFETAHKYNARSEKPVKDKFSNESHFLIYYKWEPDNGQYRFGDN